jgi:hypothetical protein
MVIASDIVAVVLFVVGCYLSSTARRRRPDLTVGLLRPIDVQARHWLDQQDRTR